MISTKKPLCASKTHNCSKSNLIEFQACQVGIMKIYLICLNIKKVIVFNMKKVLQNYSLFNFICYMDTNISDTNTVFVVV